MADTSQRLIRIDWKIQTHKPSIIVVPHDAVHLYDLRALIQVQLENPPADTLFAFSYKGAVINKTQEEFIEIASVLPDISAVDVEKTLVPSKFKHSLPRTESYFAADIGTPSNAPSEIIDFFEFGKIMDKSIEMEDTSSMRFILRGSHGKMHKTESFAEMVPRIELELDNKGTHVIWLDVEGRDPNSLREVGDFLGLHALTTEDCLFPDTRQKIEPFPNYIFIAFKSLHHLHFMLDGSTIKLLIFENIVISMHFFPMASLLNARKRLSIDLSRLPNQIIGPFDIVYCIIDSVIGCDAPMVHDIGNELTNVEELIYVLGKGEQSDLLKRMSITRRKIAKYKQHSWPKKELITNLMANKIFQMNDYLVVYYRDIYDHVILMLQHLDLHNEMLTNFESVYLAKVSIEVSNSSTESSIIMKKLSSVATIILPPTLITGLLGMNMTIPFQTEEGNSDTAPFWILTVLMLTTTIGLTMWFHRHDWL